MNVFDGVGAGKPIELKTAQLEELFLIEEGAEEAGLVKKLIDDFTKKATGHLGKIEAAVNTGDHAALENIAHSLKSSAALLGAGQLAAACADLEESGRLKRVVTEPETYLASLRQLAEESISAMHLYLETRITAQLKS